MNPLGVNAYRLCKLFNQTIETLSIQYQNIRTFKDVAIFMKPEKNKK